MTSELSNALNPRAAQSRSRTRFYSHDVGHASTSTAHHDSALRPLQSHAPHRSELELAMIPPEQPQPPVRPAAEHPPAVGVVQDLLRAVVSQSAAVQAERVRRVAWEQEQEAKHAQREAELHNQLAEMKSELLMLKASVSLQKEPEPPYPPYHPPLLESGAHTEDLEGTASPILDEQQVPQTQASYSHPSLHYPDHQLPTFVEGSSNTPLSIPTVHSDNHAYPSPAFDPYNPMLPSPTLTDATTEPPTFSPIPPSSPYTPVPSAGASSLHIQHPQYPANTQVGGAHEVSLHSPAQSHVSYATPATPVPQQPSSIALGKRRTPPSPVSEYESDESDESDVDVADMPRRRRNGHDQRCLTIQHAMRVHLLRCMRIRSKDPLPESHDETQSISANEPVRFVWGKTVKKSPHNAAMKARILKDLIAKRKRYKHVPDKDFEKKALGATFEQAFFTLRQKYKMQHDDTSALQHRRREDQKYLKARRRERKKVKLAKRTERRKRLTIFTHETFDPALHPDCMSSEESCDEYVEELYPSGVLSKVQLLRIRGHAWRSTRLLRFYAMLDAEEAAEQMHLMNTKPQPRRPLARKERCIGPHKDGFVMPPEGVASWMISRRWIRENHDAHPDLEDLLRGLVRDPPGFDWRRFDALGGESEGEEEQEDEEQQFIPRSDTSSLAHALAPPS